MFKVNSSGYNKLIPILRRVLMRPERALMRLVRIVTRRVVKEQSRKQKQKNNQNSKDQNGDNK